MPTKRCAVYCRKSVEERQATDFGSIDAQREACESFVRSQAALGWTLLPARYDDEGYTGANTDRPGMKRLLADVESGAIDVILVYKIDRLSRSIADFVRLNDFFDRHDVAFVSITQQFNTSTSVGRLTLNLLTVFAQFERETISERTRDKMRAARRRGKFTGGTLLLGYDRHPEGHRLVVNAEEAERVRAFFDLFVRTESLTAVAAETNARGWTTKSWVTKKGLRHVGGRVTIGYVRAVLSNPAYVGKVRIDGATFPAEHEAIVEQNVFDRAHALLAAHRSTACRTEPCHDSALLTGLLRCLPCDAPMMATHTTKGVRRYPYYACRRGRDEGWAFCPAKSVPAREIDRLVVEQIRVLGRDRGLQESAVAAARKQGGPGIRVDDLARALSLWEEVWQALLPEEQVRVLALLVDRVGFDGEGRRIELTLSPPGIAALSAEVGK